MWLSSILVLFMSVTTDAKTVVPIAKIVGPSTAATGRMVMLKTTGSLGDDPQITATLSGKDFTSWYVVRFADNGLGVVFDTDQPGTYIFAFGVNKSGRTAVTIHVVTVGGITPIPAKLDLSSFYKKDQAANLGKKNDGKLLGQCYLQSKSSLFESLKTYKDLQVAMHELIGNTIGEKNLPETRAAISAYVSSKLGTNASAPFDPGAVGPIWDDIVDACAKLDS